MAQSPVFDGLEFLNGGMELNVSSSASYSRPGMTKAHSAASAFPPRLS